MALLAFFVGEQVSNRPQLFGCSLKLSDLLAKGFQLRLFTAQDFIDVFHSSLLGAI
jgi:hypothetical protein